MSEVRLNQREQLIERILRMPIDKVAVYSAALNAILASPSASTIEEVIAQLTQIAEELYDMEDSRLSDAMLCAIASEPVLGKEWNTPEEDVAWADL